jgi:PAP2 superfamily
VTATPELDAVETATRKTPPPPSERRWRRLLVELALLGFMFVAYRVGRLISADDTSDAFANANEVWRIERWLRLPDESLVQQALLQSTSLVELANTYYAVVHFPATLAFLVWLFLRRPTHYLWARRTIVALTAAGLIVHVLYPLAPPRMMAGFVDTGDVYGPDVYGPPEVGSIANQFAAMPSLHVGWAVLVAFGLIAATRTRWRWLWLAHPVVTLLVVVGTANHYWLDGIVAGGLLAGVVCLAHGLPVPVPRRTVDA